MENTTKEKKVTKTSKEKAFSTINLNSFIVIVAILSLILVIVGVLTYVVPKGTYQFDKDGNIIGYVKDGIIYDKDGTHYGLNAGLSIQAVT